jgi:hypothetical protein
LYSFSYWDKSSWFLFFLCSSADSCSGKSLSTPKYSRSITLPTCFEEVTG